MWLLILYVEMWGLLTLDLWHLRQKIDLSWLAHLFPGALKRKPWWMDGWRIVMQYLHLKSGRVCACVSVCVWTCMLVCVCTYTYAYINLYTHTYLRIWVCIFVECPDDVKFNIYVWNYLLWCNIFVRKMILLRLPFAIFCSLQSDHCILRTLHYM